jgi:hypothetical protein
MKKAALIIVVTIVVGTAVFCLRTRKVPEVVVTGEWDLFQYASGRNAPPQIDLPGKLSLHDDGSGFLEFKGKKKNFAWERPESRDYVLLKGEPFRYRTTVWFTPEGVNAVVDDGEECFIFERRKNPSK